jgi:hypothetical protein
MAQQPYLGHWPSVWASSRTLGTNPYAGNVKTSNLVTWLAVRSVKWGHLLRKRRYI